MILPQTGTLPLDDFGGLISCSPLSAYIYTARIINQTKAAMICRVFDPISDPSGSYVPQKHVYHRKRRIQSVGVKITYCHRVHNHRSSYITGHRVHNSYFCSLLATLNTISIGISSSSLYEFSISQHVCRLFLFACGTRYRSAAAAIVLGRPLLRFGTAVSDFWNVLQAPGTMLWATLNFSATLVTLRPSSNFLMILPKVKSSICYLKDYLLDISYWCSNSTSFKPIYTMQ